MGLPLFFSTEFKRNIYKGKLIDHLTRQNVVLHARMTICPFKGSMRERLSGWQAPKSYPTQFSSANPDSQFRHCRYNLGEYGKVLAFRSAANLIRAGKHTHADALLSCLLFLKWSKCGRWPSRINAPNMVVSGALREHNINKFKSHAKATHSSKFPGVAIRLQCDTTTEVYSSGSFIIPGITSGIQLNRALNELEGLTTPPRA